MLRFDHYLIGYFYIFLISIAYIEDMRTPEAMGWRVWVGISYLALLVNYFLLINRRITIKKYVSARKKLQFFLFTYLFSLTVGLLFKKYGYSFTELPWIDVLLLINIVSMSVLAKFSSLRKRGFAYVISNYLLSNTILLVSFYLLAVVVNMGRNRFVEVVAILTTVVISALGTIWCLNAKE